MAGIARWCFRHRFIVIGIWIIALVVGGALTKAIGDLTLITSEGHCQ